MNLVMVESLSREESNCLSPSLAYGQVSISQQIFGLVLRNSLVAKKKKKIHLAFIWELSAAALYFHHPRGPPKGNRREWGWRGGACLPVSRILTVVTSMRSSACGPGSLTRGSECRLDHAFKRT